MENREYLEKLRTQIREAYGRVVYTYTTHLYFMNNLKDKLKCIKYFQILLSAISTGGFLATIIINEIALSWISGLVSVALLIVNLYFKDFNLSEDIKRHQVASDRLWIMREEYISLLTDFDVLSIAQITAKREELQVNVAEIYSTSPKTDKKSYKQAQLALKNEEEQFFKSEEIDRLLPEHLRKD